MTDGVTFERGDGVTALAALDELARVYVEVYAEPPYNAGPLFSVESFLYRTRRQTTRSGFAIVLARSAGDIVGFAFGFTFEAGSWWSGDAQPPPAEILNAEKFAVIELALRRPWRGHGLGRRLLDELLDDAPGEYATLTAVADAPARDLYTRWGWRQIGTAQHTPDAPVMDQLVLPLRR